jgi:excisionase family DNA binding protein
MENFTIREFCERFRISQPTAYHLIRSGKLRARKLGRRTILFGPDVEAYIASLPDFRFRAGDRFGLKRHLENFGPDPRRVAEQKRAEQKRA